MAIKLPDPGNGIPEQRTGNDEWTNMKIVRDNFADQSNAASRLVGTAIGNVVQVQDTTRAALGAPKEFIRAGSGRNVNDFDGGSLHLISQDGNANVPFGTASILTIAMQGGGDKAFTQLAFPYGAAANFKMRTSTWDGTFTRWHDVYGTFNTTVDSNKNIKTSSPVVRVFADRLDKIHEANDLPIEYVRNGVGDYTISGTTGLRENDWQIVIPKDDHDNQLIAFTIEDKNGTIRLKTYKRTFNMTTFIFEPDLNAPLDIPEGRWVDLHFNDLPQEQTDEPAI